ncbi:MAG: hypothetical protein ACRDPZ_10830, partial [Gaiellaceae bacterium]
VGGSELIGEVRAYLEDVRERVREASAGGGAEEELRERLEPEIRADYPSWDAPEWIPLAIACFYHELHG